MVLTLPLKKTTLVTLDMLKLTCPIWQGGLFDPYPNLVFLLEFPIWKPNNSNSELKLQKIASTLKKYAKVCSLVHDVDP